MTTETQHTFVWRRSPWMGSRWRLAVALMLGLALCLAAGTAVPAVYAYSSLVQIFFVPGPEGQIRATLLSLYSGTGSTLRSVVSIAATQDQTVITYDHWEDGYEADMENPAQGSTEVWGDDDPANGMPPGFASDVIHAGDIVALDNNVSLPRDGGQVRYDGGDKLGVTEIVAVTRAEWALTPGSVLAGAVEVYATNKYGTRFEAPVGEDISAAEMFEYVGLLVMAAQDGTVVHIDNDGDGIVEVTETLNQGQSVHVDGGIQTGATVMASRPVQAHLVTGDIDTHYESRWYTLYPTEQWDDSYYSPVGSTPVDTHTGISQETYIFVYNPDTLPLTVHYQTQAGTGQFSVPAEGIYQYEMPADSGAHFYSSDGRRFFAIAPVGADPSVNNNTYDWGFSLVPEMNLTTVAVVGWGPGSSDLSANGSPVWATAVNPTTLYVDYDGDPTTGPLTDPQGNQYDVAHTLSAYQSQKVFDNNDNDQTGMRLYTVDGTLITAAWGQDPATAQPGNPFLDMGTTVLPLPVFSAWKEAILYEDVSGNGVVDVGDTLAYTITVRNDGTTLLRNVVIVDVLPAHTTYVVDSTQVNGAAAPDDVVPPAATAFPLDEGGLAAGDTVVDDVSTVSFRVVIAPLPPGVDRVLNRAVIQTDDGTQNVEVETPVAKADLSITKSDSPDPVIAGETLTYTLVVTNNGPAEATGVIVTDMLPGELTLVSATASQGSCGAPEVTCDLGSIAAEAQASIVIVATVSPEARDTLVNTAEVSSDTFDPDPTNNSARELTDLLPLGELGDLVWWDVDGDGQQNGGEPGIPDVQVNLHDSTSALVGATATDANGLYDFTQLPPDTYRIEIDASEFQPGGTLEHWFASPRDVGPDETDSDGHPATHDVSTVLMGAEVDRSQDFGLDIAVDVEISKRLNTEEPMSPGEPLSFTIRISNTGDAPITVLPLRDVYDPVFLTYSFGDQYAHPDSDDHANDGQIDWSDLTQAEPQGFGSDLAPGASFTVVITFTARADTLHLLDLSTENRASIHDGVADPDGSGPLPEEALPEKEDADRVMIIASNKSTLGDWMWQDANGDGLQSVGEAGIDGVLVNLYLDDGDGLFEPGAEDILLDWMTSGDNPDTGVMERGWYDFAGLTANGVAYWVEIDDSNFGPGGPLEGLVFTSEGTYGPEPMFVPLPGVVMDWNEADFGYVLPAAIGDLVWEDRDGDGQQGDTEAGLEGVMVRFFEAGQPTPLSTTLSSGGGFYSFTGLLPGDYILEFVAPAGYAFTRQDAGDDGLDSDADPGTGQTVVTGLDAGENDLTWDGGLYRPGALGDLVWWDVDGDGQQDSGEPGISGVQVNLYDGLSGLIGTTATDASGLYTFTLLPPDVYRIEIDPSEFQPGGTLENWLASPQDAAPDDVDSDGHPATHDVSTVLVSGEEDLSHDFGFVQPPDYTISKRLNSVEPLRPGEPLSFTIRITNTGNGWITVLPLRDVYDPNYLTYSFGDQYASPDSDDHVNDGQIDWSDLTASLGSDLAPGASFTVVVTFTARTDTQHLPDHSTENRAVVHDALGDRDGPGPLSEELLPTKEDADRVEITFPTRVMLAGWQVVAQPDGLLVSWETASESEIVGFNVLRRTRDGGLEQINEALIFAKYGGANQGASYGYRDGDVISGATYEYVLEAVMADGGVERYELAPVTAWWWHWLPVVVR